jgi:hypothetical protein
MHGNCGDGLDILRAVLATGVREAVGGSGHSLSTTVSDWTYAGIKTGRISEGHALKILQALHAASVDMLAQGPADELPVLHGAVVMDTPEVVRWLVINAGAPQEERDSGGFTPLLTAC